MFMVFLAPIRRFLSLFIITLAAISFFYAPQKAYAAATIVVSSPVVASDGKTITATLSGGTGTGYGITNKTGLSIRKSNSGGVYYNIASVSVSSTTLTINGGFPFASGDTVLVDVGATNTIFDSGANNGQTLSSIATTNNSTITVTAYSSSNSAFKKYGITTSNAFQSHNYIASYSFSTRWNFDFTGTDIAVGAYTGTTVSTEVDGTTTSATGFLTNTWQVLPLKTGLTDTLHAAGIVPAAGNSIDLGTGAVTTGFILVAGSSPAISAPASRNWGTQYWFGESPWTTYGAVDGSPASIVYNGSKISYGMQGGKAFRFATDSSFINIWTIPTITYKVYQDGSLIATTAVGSSSYVYILAPLVSGLDTTSVHEYEVVVSSPLNSEVLYSTMFELGNNGLAAVSHTAKTIETFYGDSITVQTGITDATQGDAFLMGRAIGNTTSVKGASNQRASTYGRDNTSGLLTNSNRVWERWGHNDATAAVTMGAVGTPATFKGDFYTMLTNIRSRIGSNKWIFVEGIFPTTASNRTTYNTAKSDVTAAFITATGDAYVKYINTDNWMDPTVSVDTADGTHPNASGYAKIANREIPFAATSGFTVSGPSSGTAGSASTNFTVTLAGGATFTGDVSVTISDGADGGTITPSVGSPGTSSVTVTPTNGATSFTFTYNAASAGVKTLTYTNSPGWFNPGTSSYTAGASGDVTAPTITNVSSDKANGTYTEGEIIDIDVTFSEIVTSTGSVTVTLETGATDRTCTFTVTGGTTGTCNYTVQAGDTTSDLTVKTISGTIADTSSNAMTDFAPATNLAANKAIVIDTTAPTVTLSSPTGSSTISNVTSSSSISISLAETLASGSITITRTSGTADASSPHVCTLVGTGLNSGAHTINLSDTTNGCTSDVSDLVSGTIYTFALAGSDAVGNSSSSSVTGVLFDNTVAPTVTTSAASSIAATTVTLGGNITATGGANPTIRGVEYGADTSYGTQNTSSGSFSTGTFTQSVTGLTCNTLYHFRAYATNTAGTSTGSDATFTTSACPDVTAPTITNVTSTKTNGSYTTGEVIDVVVTFSEAVTSTGSVTVTLETGATDRTCTFTVTSATSGSCNYTVQAGDTTSDLTVKTISGTIADASSNAMTDFAPATNLAANKAIVIDTTVPTISSLSPADNATGVSINANPTIVFTKPVVVGSGNITIKKTSDNSTVETIGVTSGQVTGGGTDTIVINPTSSFDGLTEYYVLVDATAFDDTVGNSYAGISSTTAWSFTTADTGVPTITNVTSTKPNGSYKAGEVISINVTFSEIVNSSGPVTVTLETGATDRTCTFTVSVSSSASCNYTVQAGDTSSDLTVNSIMGTIVDEASNAMTDFDPETNLAANKNIVIDTTAPTVNVLSPLDNADNVSVITDLAITFNESVVVGTGNITIKKTSDNSTVETIDITSGQVTGGGTDTITISPSNPSLDLTEYYILMDAGALKDVAGNNYAGISSTTAWSFTTTDTTAPTITNITSGVTDGTYTTDDIIDIDVTFNEVVTSVGSVTVTLETGTTDRTCTFTVTSATSGSCDYTVQAGDVASDLEVISVSGAIADAFGNVMVDFTPATNLAANKALVIDTTVVAPTVTTSTASSVSTTTVTLGGNITATGGENATTRGVEYGADTSYGTQSTSSGSFGAGTFTRSVTGLACNTTYHFRAYAINGSGTGVGSDDTFTTSACQTTAPEVVSRTGFVSGGGFSSLNTLHVGAESNTPLIGNNGACPSGQILTQNLKSGTRDGAYNAYVGGKVKENKILQAHLNRLGFSAGKVDGILGPKSDKAIKLLQKSLGTKPDGLIGPATRKLINNSCGK